jgi:hypothetical protein
MAMDAGAHSEAAVLEGDGVQWTRRRRAGDVDVAPEVLGLVETRLDRRLVDVAATSGSPLPVAKAAGSCAIRRADSIGGTSTGRSPRAGRRPPDGAFRRSSS